MTTARDQTKGSKVTTMTETNRSDAWVCEDCYMAHHYGCIQDECGAWWAGLDGTYGDRRADREPLALIGPVRTADSTCTNHRYGQSDETDDDGDYVEPCEGCGGTDDENGMRELSWSQCDGCGSTLGGSRYRLAVWSD